jgi:hypothetical protein
MFAIYLVRTGLAGRGISYTADSVAAGHNRALGLSVRTGDLYCGSALFGALPGNAEKSARAGAGQTFLLGSHHLTNTTALPEARTDSVTRHRNCAVHNVSARDCLCVPGAVPGGVARADILCVPAHASAGIILPMEPCDYVGRPCCHRSGCVVRRRLKQHSERGYTGRSIS